MPASSALDWYLSEGDLVERSCSTCRASHTIIVYERLTPGGTIDFRDLFVNTWASAPKDGSNRLNEDFGRWLACLVGLEDTSIARFGK